jgi:hypothetical protein
LLGLLRSVAAGQAFLVGAVLLAAAGFKGHEIFVGGTERTTALDAWLGKRRARIGRAILTATEILLGVMLLTDVEVIVGAACASILLCGSTIFLLVSRRRFPHTPCGCFSARHSGPITTKTIARSAFLFVIAAGPLLAGGSAWTRALREPAAIAILGVEAALVLMLTSDLRRRRGTSLEWLRKPRLRHAVMVARRSREFQSLRNQLVSATPADVWSDSDNGCRIVLFEMAVQAPGNQRYLAFAVPNRRRQIVVSELRLRATVDGWEAANDGIPLAQPASEAVLSAGHA